MLAPQPEEVALSQVQVGSEEGGGKVTEPIIDQDIEWATLGLEKLFDLEGYRKLAGVWDSDSETVAATACSECGAIGRAYWLFVKRDSRRGFALCAECGAVEER